MGFMDEAQKAAEASKRAEQMSNRELLNNLRNSSNSQMSWDKAAMIQEAKYRTGKEERPKLCFITTAVCDSFGKADDCYELTTFRKFRDNWLINQSDGKSLIDKYYEIAPMIVEKINQLPDSNKVYESIWQNYLKPCLNFIERDKFEDCKNLYVAMVNALQKSFLR